MKWKSGGQRAQGQKEEPRQELGAPLPRYIPTEPPAAVGADEVGQAYSLELQRHRERPKLWRLRERIVHPDGSVTELHTKWAEFPDFSPDLLLAQGRLKRFIFGSGRVPTVQRVGGV